MNSAGEGNPNEGTQQEGTARNLLSKRYKKPAYLQSLNESEKAENFKIIEKMNKRVSYLRNPRYKTSGAPITLNTVRLCRLKRAVSGGSARGQEQPIRGGTEVYPVHGLPGQRRLRDSSKGDQPLKEL